MCVYVCLSVWRYQKCRVQSHMRVGACYVIMSHPSDAQAMICGNAEKVTLVETDVFDVDKNVKKVEKGPEPSKTFV